MLEGDASEVYALAAKLELATGRVGAKAAGAIRTAARDAAVEARSLAPVGDTGELRDSISVGLEGDGRFASIGAEIGPTVDYAPFVEYGTSRMAPQPFIGPAVEAQLPKLTSALEAVAEEEL